MTEILSILIFIIFVAVFPYAQRLTGNSPADLSQANVSQVQEQSSVKTAALPVAVKPVVPTAIINTYITAGPEEGETIEETNTVKFKFDAEVLSGEVSGRIYFETKIKEFNEDWKKSSSKERTIQLPAGSKEYTFLVRATAKDVIDLTPAERSFRINVSPYFKKIRISSVQTKTDSRESLVTLTTSLLKEEEINISNWYLQGKGGKIFIPLGMEKYYPFYGQFLGQDIIVKRGDKIYLSGATNPLGESRNFRVNKCMGYLVGNHDFPISIPKSCPRASSEDYSHLSVCCQQFISRLGTCEKPDYSDDYNIGTDSSCLSFLDDNFNYAGCFSNYSTDDNFLKNYWHIYLGRNPVVSDDCDTIYLRDANGLFVTKYSYGKAVCK